MRAIYFTLKSIIFTNPPENDAERTPLFKCVALHFHYASRSTSIMRRDPLPLCVARGRNPAYQTNSKPTIAMTA
jgi:hypothetical protein